MLNLRKDWTEKVTKKISCKNCVWRKGEQCKRFPSTCYVDDLSDFCGEYKERFTVQEQRFNEVWTNVERVYSTRYDCPIGLGRAQRDDEFRAHHINRR